MKKLFKFSLVTFLFFTTSVLAQNSINVVSDIKPVNSLVLMIMDGVGTSEPIVSSGSPHGFQLTPSKAKKIADADIIFWTGPEMVVDLDNIISALSSSGVTVSLLEETENLLLPRRELVSFFENAELMSELESRNSNDRSDRENGSDTDDMSHDHDRNDSGDSSDTDDMSHDHDRNDSGDSSDTDNMSHDHDRNDSGDSSDTDNMSHDHDRNDSGDSSDTDNMSQSHDDNHRNNSHDRSDRENGNDTDNMSQSHDDNHRNNSHDRSDRENGNDTDNMSQSHDDNHRNNSHDRSDRENGSDTDNMSQRNDGNSEDTSVSNDPHLHHHGIIDPHAWFDPLIAIEWLRIIKESLGEIDPENKTTYEANFQSWSAKIQELDESIATKMTITKPVYIVYHDAYQYFEERYNVSPIVSLKDQSLGESGARHISRFIDQVEGISEICVLVEPFFDENLINTVAGDIVFNIYTVDPSGINFEDSSMLYFEILNSIADSLENC